MPVIESTIISKLLGVLTFILTGGLIYVFKQLFRHDEVIAEHETALAICQVREENNDRRMREDARRRDAQRKELLQSIADHHESVVGRIDALSQKIDTIR